MRYFNKAMLVASAALCLNLSVFSQNITLKTGSVTVKEAMEQLKKSSGYSFVFSSEDLDTRKHVSISVQNGKIEDAVKQILVGQNGITYQIQNKKIILKKGTGTAVTSTVKGRVVDANGEPIIGATVKEKGTSNGTITDLDGNFVLETGKGALLDISYIGYRSVEIASSVKPLSVVLKEDTQNLDEVVILAYGTQTKRNVTGSMETVKFDELGDIPAAQFAQKLQGQITGVQINQGTGAPGQGMNIRIRGAASLSTDSSPLYVVDGFPIVGDINNLNPNEIESMTVLKDAAATALYGSRAAFGVVLITTKGAKTGKTNVSFNGYWGVQVVPEKGRPDMMNGTEWAQFRKEHYEDLGSLFQKLFKIHLNMEKDTIGMIQC